MLGDGEESDASLGAPRKLSARRAMLVMLAMGFSTALVSPPLVSRPVARLTTTVLVMAAEKEPPRPGGLVDTVRRLRADYADGAATARDYFRQPVPVGGSPLRSTTAVELCVAAGIAALQVEVVQFVAVFVVAWLCGLGVPAGLPSRGLRLSTAVQMALSSRHGARVGRLLCEAARFPLALRALRRAAVRREHVQEALARPFAVLVVAVLTTRALDRSLLASITVAPASALCGAIGLGDAAAALAEKASELGWGVTRALARTEEAARKLPLLCPFLDTTEADNRVAELLVAAWHSTIQPRLLWLWQLLVALRRLLLR